MSGPIVRTGTNPKFWSNWEKVFGNKTASSANSPAENAAAERQPDSSPDSAHAATQDSPTANGKD